MLGNNFGKTSKTYGSGKNVWHGKSKVYPVGGTVKNLSDFSAGSVIPAGSAVVLDTVNSEATIIVTAYYDATAKYAIGDAVVKGGIVYICNTTISTAEDWTEAHWTALSSISAYSTSGTYSIGALVTYDGSVYKCKSTISVAEAWTAAHWTLCPSATAAQGIGVNGFTQHDVYVDEAALDSTYGGATVSVVYEGVLLVSRLENPVSDDMIAKVPGIIAFKEA